MTEQLQRELKAYLNQCPAKAGPLIRRLDNKGALKPQTIRLIFRRLAYEAGIKLASHDGVGTHSLRHTAATDVFDRTNNVRAVQELLGHENLATTERYIKHHDTAKLAELIEGRCYDCGEDPCGCHGR